MNIRKHICTVLYISLIIFSIYSNENNKILYFNFTNSHIDGFILDIMNNTCRDFLNNNFYNRIEIENHPESYFPNKTIEGFQNIDSEILSKTVNHRKIKIIVFNRVFIEDKLYVIETTCYSVPDNKVIIIVKEQFHSQYDLILNSIYTAEKTIDGIKEYYKVSLNFKPLTISYPFTLRKVGLSCTIAGGLAFLLLTPIALFFEISYGGDGSLGGALAGVVVAGCGVFAVVGFIALCIGIPLLIIATKYLHNKRYASSYRKYPKISFSIILKTEELHHRI